VSSSAHTVFFYVDLATKFLVDHERVHLSGLGKSTALFLRSLISSSLMSLPLAVTTVVTLAEILKKDGIANIVAINTSLIPVPPEQRKPGSIKTNKVCPLTGPRFHSSYSFSFLRLKLILRLRNPKASMPILPRKKRRYDLIRPWESSSFNF